jgi:glycosyltransferase involved in cell wall biosynthesis
MALAAHRALLKYGDNKFEISWIVNEKNYRLIEELTIASLPHTQIECNHPIDVRKPSLGAIRRVISLLRKFRELKPDLILFLQGGIVASYAGILAARLSDSNFCSYIPMAPRSTELAPYRFPRIWNAFRSIYFRLVPRYITIDQTQAFNIRREHRRATVRIVENYISPSSVMKVSRKDARSYLDLPEDMSVIAVLGRIEFGQKAQDWLVTELGHDSFLCDKVLFIVGEGPDAPHLKNLLATLPYARNIRLTDWHNNMDEIYSAVDLILIPSRSEGVPLVMLEALSRRIPVVGTDRDGMASWLPAEWKFPFGDIVRMKDAIERALKDSAIDWSQIETHLSRVTDERRFAQEFQAALDEYSRSF